MNENNVDYIIDFVLPIGPTGSIGPMGPTGVIGPVINQNLESSIFVEYQNHTGNSSLNINNYSIFPINSNVFGISGNDVAIDVTGYYEFTIYSVLKKTTNQEIFLYLQTRNTTKSNRLITIKLPATENQIYFSQTKIGTYNTLQKVSILLDKPSNSDAIAEKIHMVIKKVPLNT